MRIGKSAVLLALLMISPLVQAEINAEEDFFLRPVFALSGGAVFFSDFDSSNFPIGLSHYDYNAENDGGTRGVYGGFIGAELPLTPRFNVQTGIAYYQTTNAPVTGTLSQGIDPQSPAKFDYRYKIITRQLLLETKLLANWREVYHPYVSVGLGAAFNEAKDYNVDIIPCCTTFSPEYENGNTTSFTYNLGVGLDYDIAEFLRLGVGYRFADLGKANLGDGIINNTTVTQSPEQTHLYAQEILLQLTLII